MAGTTRHADRYPASLRRADRLAQSVPPARDGTYGLGPGRKLICVKASTGRKAWSQEDPFAATLEKEHAGMVAFPDRLLILGQNGRLLLVAADPAAYRLLGSVQVCGPIWCNPAYADGQLVLRDERELICRQIVR